MAIWLSKDLKKQFFDSRESLKSLTQHYNEIHIDEELIKINIDNAKKQLEKEHGSNYINQSGIEQDLREQFLEEMSYEFLKKEKIILKVFDSLSILLQENIALNKLKQAQGSKLIIEGDLYLFINAQYWRLFNLLRGAIQSCIDKNFLITSMSARHIYETIVHCFYLLKNIEKYLINKNFKKLYFLIWDFTRGWSDDFLYSNKIQVEANVDKKKEGYFVNQFGDLPINKIPHLNDSLKFYLEYHQENKERYNEVHYCDSLYRYASQIAHPNAAGSIQFFMDINEIDKENITFKFNQNKSEYQIISLLFDFIIEINKFIDSQSKSFLNIKELFEKEDNTDNFDQLDYEKILKEYEEIKNKKNIKE